MLTEEEINHIGQILENTGLSHSEIDEYFLAHHGVKGMKWGVHKEQGITSTKTTNSHLRRKSTEVTVQQKPGRYVRTTGGKRQTASEDAVRAAAYKQFGKKSTTDSLSTKQLQEVVQRMNLEVQYDKLLKKQNRASAGRKFINSLFGNKDAQKYAIKNGPKVASGAKAFAKGFAKAATA